jgi:hypothetical protein
MKFCPVVPEICRGQFDKFMCPGKKERKKERGGGGGGGD